MRMMGSSLLLFGDTGSSGHEKQLEVDVQFWEFPQGIGNCWALAPLLGCRHLMTHTQMTAQEGKFTMIVDVSPILRHVSGTDFFCWV